MKNAKKMLVVSLVLILALTFSLQALAADSTLTIAFDTEDDMAYFEVPADSNGMWEIKDGMLMQTVPIDYAVEITNGQVFALKQFITLKDQLLKDYTIEFDYYVCTTEEVVEELYGFGVLIATNVPDGQMSAKSAENGGYGLLYYDASTTGGNKKYELYDLKKGVSEDAADWVFNGIALSNVKKFDPFAEPGKHTLKIMKTGTAFEIFFDGSSHYETNKGPVDFLYTDEAALYDQAGAVQFFAANGAVRIDNVTITSPELDLTVYEAPAEPDVEEPPVTENPTTGDTNVTVYVLLVLAAILTLSLLRKRQVKNN